MNNIHNVTVVSLLFIVLYFLGWIFPDYWWGSHSLAFLPVYINVLFVIILAITWRFFSTNYSVLDYDLNDISNLNYVGLTLLIGGGMGVLFYQFPIAMDATGDSLRFKNLFSGPDNQFKQVYLDTFLSWNVIDWQNGERTVLNGAHYLVHISGLSAEQVFKWIAAVCGCLYLMTVMLFLRFYNCENNIKITSGLLFISAPFIWMFFGHMEIYAPSVLAVASFGMLSLIFLSNPSGFKLFALFVLLYLAIKLHTGHFLLLVPFLLSLLWYYKRNKNKFVRTFNWKVLSLILLIPVAVAGFYLYFFVFQDHIDLRVTAPLNEQLFLPLFAPPAPLDRYNILSFAHIFDFFNMLLMLSSAAFFIVIVVLLFYRKVTNWNHPNVLIWGITLILYLGFFFVFNPLLGMPLDMDLFSLTGPVLIIFTMTLLTNIQGPINFNPLYRGVIVLSFFTLPLILVNANASFVAKKLTSLGVRTFGTYWMGAVRPMLVSMAVYANDLDEFDLHVDQLLKRIKKDVTDKNDIEYAELLRRIALQYSDGFHQADVALEYYKQSYYFNIANKRTALSLLEGYFKQGDFAKSYEVSQQLIAIQYPSYETALRIAIHCALMNENYQAAIKHSHEYLKLKPEDEFMQSINTQLKSGINLKEIKNAFQN